MIRLNTVIPAIAISLSSLAFSSYSNNNAEINPQSPTNSIIKEPTNDTFEKESDTKRGKLALSEIVVSVIGMGTLAYLYRRYNKFVDSLKNDPNGARTWLDINGDNYL